LFSLCYILLWINDLQPPYGSQERHPVFFPSKIQKYHAVVEISFVLKVKETKKRNDLGVCHEIIPKGTGHHRSGRIKKSLKHMDTARNRNLMLLALCQMSLEIEMLNAHLHYIHGSVMMLLFPETSKDIRTIQHHAYVRKTKGGTLVLLLSPYVGSRNTWFSVAR